MASVVAPPPVPALDVKEKEQEGDKESSSEKRRYTGLLYVQPDWHKAEQDDTFWVSSHTTDGSAPDVFSDIRVGTGSSYTCSDGFSASRVAPLSLQLAFPQYNASTHFIAPSSAQKLDQLPVSVDCSPLGHIVVAGAAGMLKVIQPDLKTEVTTLSGHTFDVSTCAFFPSGKVILSGGMDMSLRVWSVATGHCAAILLGHSGAVLGTAFVGRGRNVVSCGRDSTVRLWDVSKARNFHTWHTSAAAYTCTVVPHTPSTTTATPADPEPGEVGTEGNVIVAGSQDGALIAFDARCRNEVFHSAAGSAINTCTAAAAAGATGSTLLFAAGDDGVVRTWDLRQPKQPRELFGGFHGAQATKLHYVPANGTRPDAMWVSTSDGSCQLWQRAKSQQYVPVAALCGPDCEPVRSFSVGVLGTEPALVTVSNDCGIRRYAIESSTLLQACTSNDMLPLVASAGAGAGAGDGAGGGAGASADGAGAGATEVGASDVGAAAAKASPS